MQQPVSQNRQPEGWCAMLHLKIYLMAAYLKLKFQVLEEFEPTKVYQ
tara:strand:+ start:104 stop:244 length:141 start_codon:yes stop_codon:yes gene_type:complete